MSKIAYKKISVFITFIFLQLGSFSAMAAVSGLPDFTRLVEEYSDAVVNISTTQKIRKNRLQQQIPNMPDLGPFNDYFRRFFEQQNYQHQKGRNNAHLASLIKTQQTNESLGSGFIIDSDGYVVTNNHVVKDADEIIVRLKDRRELKAKVVGTDKRSDIALLKIDADDLPVIKIGSSKKAKVGEWVMAIGSPFGFDHSVSVGVISALGRTLPSENYVPFIQTDVAINPGNSGGPLFNLKGEVIGINSQIYSRTGGFMGLSFAIPIDVAMDIIKQIKRDGHARWGWLGVLIQDVNKELAESFDMEKPMGAVVLKVLDDTPAKKAGIEVGDVITHFNGRTINRSSDLPLAVGQAPIGSRVKVRIIRDGKVKNLRVKIAEIPQDEELAERGAAPKEKKSNRLNIDVIDMSREQRKRAGVDHGIRVQNVEEGPADSAGIRAGDILLKIDGKDIKSSRQFLKIVKSLPENKWIRVLIQRGDSPRFLALKIGE